MANYRIPITDVFDCSCRVDHLSVLTDIGVNVLLRYYPERPSPSAQFRLWKLICGLQKSRYLLFGIQSQLVRISIWCMLSGASIVIHSPPRVETCSRGFSKCLPPNCSEKRFVESQTKLYITDVITVILIYCIQRYCVVTSFISWITESYAGVERCHLATSRPRHKTVFICSVNASIIF